MTEKDALYFGALLHDVGKFIERAKMPNWQQETRKYITSNQVSEGYAHRRYSAKFVRDVKEQFGFSDLVESLVLHHHKGNNPIEEEKSFAKLPLIQLLKLADQCASAEREEDKTLKAGDYHRARLQSPFYEIELDEKRASTRQYMGLHALSTQEESVFAANKEHTLIGNAYEEVVKDFLGEVGKLHSADELYDLMHRWMHSSPAQSPISINGKETLSIADISLFDHSRTVAALALCLFDEWKEGSWKDKEAHFASKEQASQLNAPCLLVRGDISGIQKFIFNIVSKGAAKQLKARSFLVQMLTECIVKWLVKELALKSANILYSGGGNFNLLVPACRMTKLHELRKTLEMNLLDQELYVALGWTEVLLTDFEGKDVKDNDGKMNPDKRFRTFGSRWKEAHESCERQKRQRFKSVGMTLFKAKVLHPEKENTQPSDKLADLTQELSKAKGYKFVSTSVRTRQENENWQRFFRPFGFQLVLVKEPDSSAILFNDTNFAGTWKGFRFYVNELPRWTPEMIENFADVESDEPRIEGSIVDFKALANQAKQRTGTDKIAVLKMDVDNLGQIFIRGLPSKYNTIARIASISRSLQWFFEGHLNRILKDGTFSSGNDPKAMFGHNIYVIFSGGDDFFAVGAWDAIYAFAEEIRTRFIQFVQHPAITISGSLTVVSSSFPVIRFAEIAEERLDEAKDIEIHPHKNAIHILDENLTWEELQQANYLSNRLEELVNKYASKRAVIGKVQSISEGYGALLEEVKQGKKLPIEKVWRLGYLFRDERKNKKIESHDDKQRKKIVEEIVSEHQNLLARAFMNPRNAMNPALFSVGARKAELLTRLKPNQEND